jgi:hypothetical protein
MDLIGPAMLTSDPRKPNGMQAVAFVPEMSHFHVQMGCIFEDQLQEHKDFESTIKNDPIKLLEAIQVLMQNPMQARYTFATMTDAFAKVLNYCQLEGQDLTKPLQGAKFLKFKKAIMGHI